MVKLELLFDSGSTEVRTFPTKKEAEWYARNEGDHVWDYNILPFKEQTSAKVRSVR